MSEIKYYKRKKYAHKTEILCKQPFDRLLCEVLQQFRFLRYITPLNNEHWRNLYTDNGIPKQNPEFVYRDIHHDFDEIKKKLALIKPFDEITLILARKAKEISFLISLIEARNTKSFREISRFLFGTVDKKTLAKSKDWLTLAPEAPTTINFDSFYLKRKLENDIAGMGLNVKVKLRKYLTSRAAAGVGTIGLKIDALYTNEDYNRIITHEIETHIFRAQNGLRQPLKSLFYFGFPRLSANPGGYLKTEEGLAIFHEEKAGILTARRKRIIAARVLAVHLMDNEDLKFNEVFEVLTKEYQFKPHTAYDICERVFRAGGYTKDQLYFKGYEIIREFMKTSNKIDLRLLFTGKIGLEWLPLIKSMIDKRLIIPPFYFPKCLENLSQDK